MRSPASWLNWHVQPPLSSVVSLNVLSAVDMNLGAVHIGRRVGAQDIDDLCDFIRRAESMHGDVLRHDLLGARGQDRGVYLPRSDGVDPNAEWSKIGSHLARERRKGRLGSGIGGACERVPP